MRDRHHDELYDLIGSVCNGTAMSEQRARLELLMASDRDARLTYLRYTRLHCDLRAQIGIKPIELPEAAAEQSDFEAVASAPQQSFPVYRKGHEPKPTPFIIYPIAIAAAALLTAAIVVVYLLAFNTDPQPDPIKPDQPGPPVATLIENTGDLQTPHGYPAEGEDFSAGEYTLSNGTAEFMLTNAVNVRLNGPSRLRMHSDMRLSLTDGRAAFVVPSGAKGFTVNVPGGVRIVDLGTAFVVDTNDRRETLVRVTDGSVRIEYPDGQGDGVASEVIEAGGSVMLVSDDTNATRRIGEHLIYAHGFDGPPARALNGTAPYNSDRGYLWSAHPSWNADGTKPSPATGSASLPFTPEPGRVYTLSVDANPDAGESTDWFGLGFAQSMQPHRAMHQDGDAAWMLVRMDDSAADVMQTFHGPRIEGPADHGLDPEIAGPVRLTVVLDTREPKWTVEWRVNGEHLRGPFVYDTNPTITRVGFDALESAVGSIDNFRLTEFASAPDEPSEPSTIQKTEP